MHTRSGARKEITDDPRISLPALRFSKNKGRKNRLPQKHGEKSALHVSPVNDFREFLFSTACVPPYYREFAMQPSKDSMLCSRGLSSFSPPPPPPPSSLLSLVIPVLLRRQSALVVSSPPCSPILQCRIVPKILCVRAVCSLLKGR